MSYDLVVFDPRQAPKTPAAFLIWYEQQPGTLDDPGILRSVALHTFFALLCNDFPAMNGPCAVDDKDHPRLTDYGFGPYEIYMCFPRSQSEAAQRAVVACALKSGVGVYAISSRDGYLWRPPESDQYGVYYRFYGSDENVPGTLPIALTIQDVVTAIIPKMVSDADFFGLVDPNGVTLQFMLHKEENRIWMEIPDPEKKGSHGTYLPPSELKSRVEALPRTFSVEAFPELQFESWNGALVEYNRK